MLAGGRSARLGVPKQSLRLEGRSLLERALSAVAAAHTVIVVGPEAPDNVPRVREEPPFGGPAAAVAAGLEALPAHGATSDHVLVLACDMPDAAVAVATLLDVLRATGEADGVVAVDAAGRLQPLAAVYRVAALREAVARLARVHPPVGTVTDHGPRTLDGVSMMRLLDGLRLTRVGVPEGSTDDVDTWRDARRFGIGQDGDHG